MSAASYDKMKNTTLRDKLREAIPSHNKAKIEQDILSNVNRIGVEGEDHILIDYQSTSDIGKALSISCRGKFKHKILGTFQSFKGFWHYIRCHERDDRLRDLVGRDLEVFAAKLTPIKIQNFRALILDGLYQKVKQDTHILGQLRKSTIPFDHYSYENKELGLRRRRNDSHWIIGGCEEIRAAVKQNREPDFSKYMNGSNVDLEAFIIKEFIDSNYVKDTTAVKNDIVEEKDSEHKQVAEPSTSTEETYSPEYVDELKHLLETDEEYEEQVVSPEQD